MFNCEICGMEIETEKQLRGHLIHCKKKSPVESENKPPLLLNANNKEANGEYITSKQLDNKLDEFGGKLIAQMIETLNPNKKDNDLLKKYQEEEMEAVVPNWVHKLIDEHLGEEFERKVVAKESCPTLVKISVPLDKSNAASAHIKFYGKDIRSVILANDESKTSFAKKLLVIKNNLMKPKDPLA